MLRLLFGLGTLVLVAVWLVGPASSVPTGASQYAPPPTPRANELSVSLSANQLAQRLAVPVAIEPNVLSIGSATGHVDLQLGRAIAVLSEDDLRRALQSVLDQEQARIGLRHVKSVSITPDQLLLIGTAN